MATLWQCIHVLLHLLHKCTTLHMQIIAPVRLALQRLNIAVINRAKKRSSQSRHYDSRAHLQRAYSGGAPSPARAAANSPLHQQTLAEGLSVRCWDCVWIPSAAHPQLMMPPSAAAICCAPGQCETPQSPPDCMHEMSWT
jgi:hypothetical protein